MMVARSLLIAAMVAAATAIVTFRGVDDGPFWQAGFGLYLFLVSVSVIAAKPLWDAVNRFRVFSNSLLRRRVEEVLAATLGVIYDVTGFDWRTIGVSAYLVQIKPSFDSNPPHLHATEQRLLVRRRHHTVPHPKVRWTSGKGAIGQAWEKCEEFSWHARKEWPRFPDYTRSQWEGMRREERLFLAWDEYRAVRPYGAVIATPILEESGKVIGIVTTDVRWDESAPERLFHPDVSSQLMLTAEHVAGLIALHKGTK